MSPNIAIRGDGIAARCCAHLLTRAGFRVQSEPADQSRVPAIMIADAAASLIRDVFDRPDALHDAPRVRARVVCWGPGAEIKRLDHSACVVSEQKLLASLGGTAAVPAAVPINVPADAPDFTLYAAGAPPGGVSHHSFGARRATAAQVELHGSEPAASYIESLSAGWLFLVPCDRDRGWLLAIGSPLEEQLEQSHLIAPLVASLLPAGDFPACPRVALPLAGTSWLACGSAALGFDPICGDGAAQAVREAILAAAVVRAIAAGGDAISLQAHYQSRLLAGLHRHLALCADFYRSGGPGPWWQEQTDALADGLRLCAEQLALLGPPRYRLVDYRLEPLPR